MDCERASLLIEEFYDGEIDLHLKSRVEEHIVVCSFCSAEFYKVRSLDQLLEKSSAPPPPSAMLDRKLIEALHQNQKALKSPAWWHRLFAGSLSIPKPAFAAAVIMGSVAIAGANIIGRYAVTSSDVSLIPAVPSLIASTPLPPEIIEKTKIVEVPVIKERVVTRVVYVERQSNETNNSQKSLLAQDRTGGNKQKQNSTKEETNSSINAETSEYVTRGNLSGFQPIAELKTRIIQDTKQDEE
jgi:hypothetical protein